MARIDMLQEEKRASERRSTLRQDKRVPLLIRDDGKLYPNVPLVARKPNFRPYHGPAKASLEDRMRYLEGLGAKRAVIYTEQPDEPFDIGKADADQLAQFAQEQYGAVIDTSKPLKVLREHVFKLSQLPDPGAALPDPMPGADDDEPSATALPPVAGQLAVSPNRGGRQPRGANKGNAAPAGGLGLSG